jgi:uncharacterized membrane protein
MLHSRFSFSNIRYEGPLAYLLNFGMPYSGWILWGIAVLNSVLLLVGGISIILRQERGMHLALIALTAELVMVWLPGLVLLTSLALGWVVLDFPSAPRAFIRTQTMRFAWSLMLIPYVMEGLILVAIFLWVRRELERMKVELARAG